MGARKKTTTKQDLVVKVASRTGLTRNETRIAVEEILSVFAEELVAGHNIEMRGFGTFYTKERNGRPARNPRSGAVVQIPKRVVPLFKYSGSLKKKINEKDEAKTA